jgi:Zn-dependent protease
MGGYDWEGILIGLIVIILSITLHEFGHAYSADRLGDPLPRRQGRVTLWPDKHFDPLGFIMILFTQIAGFGIGWGKPVQIDGGYFRHPRRDDIIVTIAGPAMNLLLAVLAALAIRTLIATGNENLLAPDSVTGQFAMKFLLINLGLMFFNLLPIFPLDGSHIIRNLLPEDMSRAYWRFMIQWGPMLLLGLVFFGRSLLSAIIFPAIISMARLLVGTF